MTARTRYFVISSVLVTFVGVGSGLVAYYTGSPAGAVTGRGGPEELQYIPSDAAVVAYADVRHVMASELRQRIRQAVPGLDPTKDNAQLEFQNRTGINIETDIDHVVASFQADAAGGNGHKAGLVLARGTFNEVKIESLMREHGAQVEPYKAARLIVATIPASDSSTSPDSVSPQQQELGVAFLKPGLVAIGTPALIRRAVDLENGGDSITTNDEVMNLVRSLDSGNVWAVGRFDALGASAKLPSGIGELPPITLFSASGTIDDNISGVVRAEVSSDEAAKNLRDVVQGIVALANLQASSKPELKAVVQSLQLSGTGKTVALSFSIPGGVVDLLKPQIPPQPADPQRHQQ
jgi:hypothetical protein